MLYSYLWGLVPYWSKDPKKGAPVGPGKRRGRDLLAPYAAAGMVAHPVNRRVNDPKNDDSKLIEPEPA